MRFRTSNFWTHGKHPQAVAISLSCPKWYRGRRYRPLAPPGRILHWPKERYEAAYAKVLAGLDPAQVADDLGNGAVLLCWEPPSKFCHRQLVADWLRSHGHKVTEVGKVVHRQSKPKSAGLFD